MLLCIQNRVFGVVGLVVYAGCCGGRRGVLVGSVRWWWVFEESVEVAGDVPFEAAAGFAGGFSLGGAFGYVGLGFGAGPGAGDSDDVERMVEGSVTASMLLWLSNRVLVGCEAGEPLLVLGGEVVVVAAASFELREEGGVGLERLGGVGEGDVGLLA